MSWFERQVCSPRHHGSHLGTAGTLKRAFKSDQGRKLHVFIALLCLQRLSQQELVSDRAL